MARKDNDLTDRIDAIINEQVIQDERPHMQAINGWLETTQALYNEASDLMFNLQDTRAYLSERRALVSEVARHLKSCEQYTEGLIVEVRKMRMANDKIRKRLKLNPLTSIPNDEEEEDE